MYLSGTFGELRTNHFHAGIDIKTQQKEGLKVVASAQGYVSRIKVSHWGYGKALYITHPNGYTTVYAHLKKFSPKIESYLKLKQYQKESFEIQLYPNKEELIIDKGEVVAFSGSTGGFVGPHLHFEIRDNNSKPINPLLFGIEKVDTKKPTINALVAYTQNDSSQVNKSNAPLQINFKTLPNGNLLADKITASGKIGFGINTYDRLDGALNKNGIYDLSMKVNGVITYQHTVETFSFAESKYINLLIDYTRYAELSQRIQRCFVVPRNKLSIYKNVIDDGYISIKDSLTYNVEITASDFSGNQKKLIIPIEGKAGSIEIFRKEKLTPYKIISSDFNKFSNNGVTISFPKNTFYEDFYLDFNVKDSIATIHKKNIPINNNYTLAFDVKNYSEATKKQLYIAKIDKNGYTSYKKTVKKPGTFYTSMKDLGKFTLLSDTQEPAIKLSNFKNEQWMTNYRRLVVKVSDEGSGLKSYRGEIDGEWVLFEYSPKHGTLTYDFSDKKFVKAQHKLKVIVNDNVGNTNMIEATFYRKK
ncbi:MAG: M23 family metallopeptidase [Urechidicola sp.]|nr:M23 family metallopeptidase [Urechidicola sp.]